MLFEEIGLVQNVAPVLATELRLSAFRNIHSQAIKLGPSLNAFIGRNAQGKTSILEGLYAVATTRSFRGAKDQDLIRHGSDAAAVQVTHADGEQLRLQLVRDGRRTAFLNGHKLGQVSKLMGRLPTVCFSAGDLAIVAGEPADRRRFIDTELCQLSPAYLTQWTAYRRAMDQRNACLKALREGSTPEASLEPWDQKAAHSGSVLRELRSEYLEELGLYAANTYSELARNGEGLSLSYVNQDGAAMPEELMEVLRIRRAVDIAAGVTTAGPHRDDLGIEIGEKRAKPFGSQGQQRSAVLAIKLAVACYWRDKRRKLPILLLDDIMSDLDETRRQRVLDVSFGLGQVLLTATEASQTASLAPKAQLFSVDSGEVSPA